MHNMGRNSSAILQGLRAYEHAALDVQREGDHPRPHDLGTRKVTVHSSASSSHPAASQRNRELTSWLEKLRAVNLNTRHQDLNSGQQYPNSKESLCKARAKAAPHRAGSAPRIWLPVHPTGHASPHPANRAPRSPLGAARSPRRAQVAGPAVTGACRSRGSRSGSWWGSGRGGAPWTPDRAHWLGGCARLPAARLTAPPPAPKAADWAVPFFCLSVVCLSHRGFPRDFPVT